MLEIQDTKQYHDFVDMLASKSVERMIETAGGERYQDDISQGMMDCIAEIVEAEFLDEEPSAEARKNLIKFSDNTVSDIESHVESVDFGNPNVDYAEVNPVDVEMSVGVSLLKSDVTDRVAEAYSGRLKEAATK